MWVLKMLLREEPGPMAEVGNPLPFLSQALKLDVIIASEPLFGELAGERCSTQICTSLVLNRCNAFLSTPEVRSQEPIIMGITKL